MDEIEKMDLHCAYHPTEKMRVVTQSELKRLMATGYWFKHPTDAKNMRAQYEKEIRESRSEQSQGLHNAKRQRSRNRKKPSQDGGSPAQ